MEWELFGRLTADGSQASSRRRRRCASTTDNTRLPRIGTATRAVCLEADAWGCMGMHGDALSSCSMLFVCSSATAPASRTKREESQTVVLAQEKILHELFEAASLEKELGRQMT